MSEFFKCSCGSELLEIEVSDDKSLPPEAYISMWRLGNFGRVMNFKERLRWIWHILRTGMPWTDSISLNYKEFKNLNYAIMRAHSKLKKLQYLYELNLIKDLNNEDKTRICK